jgi:hypothetical protein
MQHKSVITKSLVVAACVLLVSVATSNAADSNRHRTSAQATPPKERIVLVKVTGSWIPQRVVLSGRQVNSASPVSMVFADDAAGGSTNVLGMLSLEPSITRGRR